MAAETADTRQEHVATTEAVDREMCAALGNEVSQDDGEEPPKEDQVTGDDGNVTPDDGEEDPVPSYDITPPVIENFEFKENGQALTADDTLHFTMSVYDAESGIDSVCLYIASKTGGHVRSVYLEKSGEGNQYTDTLPCSKIKGDYGNQFYISGIWVHDKAGNYVTLQIWDDETGQECYTFELDYESDLSVSNFRMETHSSREDGKLVQHC